MKKLKWALILAAFTTTLVYGYMKGKEAAQWRQDWQAVSDELEAIGFQEMEEGKPEIADLPAGAEALGVLEGEVEATASVPVHPTIITKVKWKTPACPAPGEKLGPVVQELREELTGCTQTLSSCPTEPWLLVSDVKPSTLGAMCRAEWSQAPGKVFGRLWGQGLVRVGGDIIRGDFKQVNQFSVKTIAPEQVPRLKRWVFAFGLHLERFTDQVSASPSFYEENGNVSLTSSGTQLSPFFSATRFGAHKSGLRHRWWGWHAGINGYDMDSLSVRAGVALSKP